MKILHLSKSDDKGAFLAAYRFHKQLLSQGHQSVMLVEKKNKQEAEVVEVKIDLWSKLYIKLFRHISSLLVKYRTRPGFYFFNYFESLSLPLHVFTKSLPFSPDIIFVHWVTGYINNETLHRLHQYANAPVIWRFNDMNPFTGGCHYSNGCDHFTKGCGNCPALYASHKNDRSYRTLEEKKKWVSKTNLTFISSTTEIDDQLRNSAIARAAKTKFIMLSCSSDVFKPAADKNVVAAELGLPANRKIIFFGAQDLNDPRKGIKELAEALHMVKKHLSEEVAEKILLVYATNREDIQIELPFETIRIPFSKNDVQLAKAYQ